MSVTLSPNMFLPIATVGDEAGPDYAFDANASFTLIDRHDHTIGSGVQLTPGSFNINTSLNMQSNSLINTLDIVFVSQSSASTVLQSLSVAPGGEGPPQQDLWYTPDTGVPIQITKNGIVNTIASTIPGESYAAGTFIWTQTQSAAPTTPANFDIGSITLRPNIALTNYGVTLSPTPSIASSYTIYMPADPGLLPGGNMAFLTYDSGGQINGTISTVQGITGSMIANLTITGAQIALQTIAGNITPGASIIVDHSITSQQIAANTLSVEKIQDFTTPGASSFTVPAGVTALHCLVVGGGGGGGGGGREGAGSGSGGSGGGATLPIETILNVTPGQVYTINVGAAGVGGAQQNGGGLPGNDGTNGGDSSIFLNTILKVRSLGGIFGPGSAGTPGPSGWFTTAMRVQGGSGGAGVSNGTAGFDSYYGTGGSAGLSTGGTTSGGGGGGAGFGDPSNPGDGGGGSNGGSPILPGSNGNGYGSGGGGGGSGNNGSGNAGHAGGNGAGGLVRITWVAPP